MAKETETKATSKKAGKFTAAINAVKELDYDDRGKLIKALNEAHAEDLNQNSLGQAPEGKGYDSIEDNLAETDEGNTN